MLRFTHRFLAVVVAACALAQAASAQDGASPSRPDGQPAIQAPAAGTGNTTTTAAPGANPIVAAPGASQPNAPLVAPKPQRARTVSAEVAAQLAAATPKYVPPPPKPATPPEDEPDLRDIDKPRNQIIRLPKVVVHAPPPPVFSERAINTKKGLSDLAMKRYLTETDRVLNAISVPLFGQSAQSRAMMLYEEDERLKNMTEMKDEAAMVSATDKDAGAYVKREVERTFIRPGDFDWQPMGH